VVPAAISIQRNGFEAMFGTSIRRVDDWHTNCFEEIRKEKADEDQDELESWPAR
jgi:hypothetical protein